MARTLVLALPTLLLTVSLAPAQSYSSRPAVAGNPQTLVHSWTEGYLRREPTPAARTWIQSLRTGHSPADVQSSILASEEYFLGAGGNRPAYVRQLYADVIGRAPMPAEINYWLGRLRYDSRKDVVAQMLRYHPRHVSGMRPVRSSYDPDYFPDPVSPSFRDPSGPYFHSPYFYNYEKSRAIRAFMLGSQG